MARKLIADMLTHAVGDTQSVQDAAASPERNAKPSAAAGIAGC